LFMMVISLLMSMLPASLAHAATTRRVAKSGVDQGDCTATACLTIKFAINQAVAGDTIIIAAGVYTENLTIGKSLTLSGAGKDTTIIDGNRAGGVIVIPIGFTVSIVGVTL